MTLGLLTAERVCWLFWHQELCSLFRKRERESWEGDLSRETLWFLPVLRWPRKVNRLARVAQPGWASPAGSQASPGRLCAPVSALEAGAAGTARGTGGTSPAGQMGGAERGGRGRARGGDTAGAGPSAPAHGAQDPPGVTAPTARRNWGAGGPVVSAPVPGAWGGCRVRGLPLGLQHLASEPSWPVGLGGGCLGSPWGLLGLDER